MSKTPALPDPDDRLARWIAASRAWTDDLRLRDPEFLETAEQATAAGAADTLACINALSFRTLLNLHEMRARGVEAYLDTFMAHEIGHHSIAPAGFTNQMRLIAAATMAARPADAPAFVNLALDLLINDILVRDHQLPCVEIYRQLTADGPGTDAPFLTMLGAMEQLWGCGPLFDRAKMPPIQGFDTLVDALVATYELHGEGRRGAQLIPYVTLAALIFHQARERSPSGQPSNHGGWDHLGHMTKQEQEALRRWLRAGGLLSVDAAIRQGRNVLGNRPGNLGAPDGTWRKDYAPGLLNGMGPGMPIRADEAVIAYYESMANGHLLTFLAESGGHNEGYPESLREWTWGEPLEDVAWIETTVREGVIIPGVNTLAWELGYDAAPIGAEPFPVDLDLYVDTSGSMPNPLQSFSHICLGAFIFALSVLRQGGAVRATIWSWDMDQLVVTHGFSTDKDEVLGVLCHSIQGGTQFPVPRWEAAPDDHKGRPNHVYTAILSDDGIDTWFRGRYPAERADASMATVQRAFGAGGAVLLNGRAESIGHALPENWLVRGCRTWEEVVAASAEIAARRFKLTRS